MTNSNEAPEAPLREEDLMQFTGTEHWYRHPLVHDVTYTDGVRYLAQRAGAYWLIDEIALAQRHAAAVKAEEFQVWKLAVFEDKSASLSCEDGNGRSVYAKVIDFTDFPLEEIEIWFSNSVMYLPSEH